jgi:hypothetical protein
MILKYREETLLSKGGTWGLGQKALITMPPLLKKKRECGAVTWLSTHPQLLILRMFPLPKISHDIFSKEKNWCVYKTRWILRLYFMCTFGSALLIRSPILVKLGFSSPWILQPWNSNNHLFCYLHGVFLAPNRVQLELQFLILMSSEDFWFQEC